MAGGAAVVLNNVILQHLPPACHYTIRDLWRGGANQLSSHITGTAPVRSALTRTDAFSRLLAFSANYGVTVAVVTMVDILADFVEIHGAEEMGLVQFSLKCCLVDKFVKRQASFFLCRR